MCGVLDDGSIDVSSLATEALTLLQQPIELNTL
jgi:hypothetical protein